MRDRLQAEALADLQAAVDNGLHDREGLQTDPDLQSLRELPEFKSLLERLPKKPPEASVTREPQVP